jgi:hypothetical protein
MSAVAGGQFLPEQLAFLPDHQAVARIDERVALFTTRPPLQRVRRLTPTAALSDLLTPPDPLEVTLQSHDTRDPYTTARRPRRHAA